MLKKRLVIVALVLAFSATLAPAPSQAAPWGWAGSRTSMADGLVVKIERWLRLLLNGTERPARQEPAQQKNGCGIDPNGSPLCGPGPGPSQATAPADPSEQG
ncbi:MAG TPA: hypothetical protein VKK31_28340 [Thermoanaerobaculia bacterium]|nr:hypothetical protein [Thermoanaerobaculia bacterium]